MQASHCGQESGTKKMNIRRKFYLGMIRAILATAFLTLVCDLSVAVQLLDPPANSIDAAASIPIRKLLTDDWKLGPANAAESKKTFASASPKTEMTLVAYALNRLQQNQTKEAKDIVEELTSSFPNNLDGWMLKTWIHTLEDKYDVALINMRSLKKQIDNTPDLKDSTKVQIYKRLGRLTGYMQGPVSSRVNSDILDGTIATIAHGIAPDVLNSFSEARDQVLKQYDDLLNTQADKTQLELDKVQAENEQEKLSLERQNELLEQSEAQLIPQKQKLEAEANQQVSNLQGQGSMAQQQMNQISSDIQATQLNLQYMYFDLDAILQQQQLGYAVSTYAIRNQIRNAENAIYNLRISGNQLSNQLGGLNSQIRQIQYSAGRQLRNLNSELKRISGAKRRNLGKLARIASGPVVADGKRSAMKIRATALRTYDELPLELYRQQILDLLTVN